MQIIELFSHELLHQYHHESLFHCHHIAIYQFLSKDEISCQDKGTTQWQHQLDIEEMLLLPIFVGLRLF